MRPRLVCAVKVAAAAGLGMALWLVPVSATARPAKGSAGLAFHANVQASNQKPAGWNEPSAIAGSDGELYIAAQNGTTTGLHNISLFQSSNGRAWHEDKPYVKYLADRPEGQLGDVTMTADQSGTVFVGYIRYFSSALQTNIDWTR